MNLLKILIASGLALIVSGCQTLTANDPFPGRWLAGDFHNHTCLTDGERPMPEVFSHAFGFGLDWIANSEHGGAFDHNPQGEKWSTDTSVLNGPPKGTMWRWQSLWQFSYPLVVEARATWPDKLIIQGYEWNVPSHDHASVGIVGTAEEDGKAIARHEYLFDAKDLDTAASTLLGVKDKSTTNTHDRAVAGVRWLEEHFPANSYFLANHPSRQLQYTVADLRDFNDAAPHVAFGFEGIPGHQKSSTRGGYGNGPFIDATGKDITNKARTYGGADYMIAQVGGLWDALLGEGRHFFAFVNSDFHNPENEFWPGEYAKDYVFVPDQNHDGKYSLTELLEGMRSGNSFIVQGDLINGLEFTATTRKKMATMGSTLNAKKGDDVEIKIRFRSPATNNNGDPVTVEHIDLIAGEVGGRVTKYLADGITPNPAYAKDTNETTQVMASFSGKDWQNSEQDPDGWRTIIYHAQDLQHDAYFRLRGTNLACGVPGETDTQCNPQNDDLLAPNSAVKAYADLWFYSNPIFVTVTR